MTPQAPEEGLARALLGAFRPEFAEREPSAKQLSELILDAVSAALPLTRYEPADPALAELEGLAQHADVYAWDGAPGWDVVLARGLLPRAPIAPGPPVLDGIGARPERTQQRGELKRRAHAEAARLVAAGQDVAKTGSAAALVAAHASFLRLVGFAAAAPLLSLPEDPAAGELVPARREALLAEMDTRGEPFMTAQEEWLARLLADNPAAAAAPAFRTFYAGLSQSLRVAWFLRLFAEEAGAGRLAPDPEALLGAVGTWQPVRWARLRGGAPSRWIEVLCPPAPEDEPVLRRLERECGQALDLFSRLWFARGLSLTGFTALGALFTARCAAIVALWEEAGGGGLPT
ncbi:MAG TPA: hypothetical protein VEP66_21935 [Myxococcales bacterium]|nr:hypothetical protein [Myxococcales bacterium]